MKLLSYLKGAVFGTYATAALRMGRDDTYIGLMIDFSADSFLSVVAHYRDRGHTMHPYTTKRKRRINEQLNLGLSAVPVGTEGRIIVEPFKGFVLECSPTSIEEMEAWVQGKHAKDNKRGDLHTIPNDTLFNTRLYVPARIDDAIKSYPWSTHREEVEAQLERYLSQRVNKPLAIATPAGPVRFESFRVEEEKN